LIWAGKGEKIFQVRRKEAEISKFVKNRKIAGRKENGEKIKD